MKNNLRLLAFYLVPIVLLSSVDIAYEWSSPLRIEDGTTVPWCDFAGLRNGVVILGNHEGGSVGGLILTPHAPQFVPLPFYLGAGPEGGGMFITIWFIGLVVWGAHALLRMRSKRNTTKNANDRPQSVPDTTAQQADLQPLWFQCVGSGREFEGWHSAPNPGHNAFERAASFTRG